MSAMVDGVTWMAATTNLEATTKEDIPGGYRVVAIDTPGVSFRQISLELYNIDEPGTYPFGVTATVVGAYASLTMSGSRIWHTPYTGDAGSLTITSIDADRIAGTFQFGVTPFPFTSTTGTHTITEGQFDLPVAGTVTPVAEGHGSTVTASFDGSHVNAASVIVTSTAPSLFFSAFNDVYDIAFSIANFTGPDDYELTFDGTVRGLIVNAGTAGPTGSNCCWGVTPEDTGTVSVTSFTEDRIVGTFQATLHPRSNSDVLEPLVITDGRFDVGRQVP